MEKFDPIQAFKEAMTLDGMKPKELPKYDRGMMAATILSTLVQMNYHVNYGKEQATK